MEKVEWFGCYDEDEEYIGSELSETVKGAIENHLIATDRWKDSLEMPRVYYFSLDETVELTIAAGTYEEIRAEDGDDFLKELARVRVRLGLTVEIVEEG